MLFRNVAKLPRLKSRGGRRSGRGFRNRATDHATCRKRVYDRRNCRSKTESFTGKVGEYVRISEAYRLRSVILNTTAYARRIMILPALYSQPRGGEENRWLEGAPRNRAAQPGDIVHNVVASEDHLHDDRWRGRGSSIV